jgi:hypothetical protein
VIPDSVHELAERRQAARDARDFARADELREEIRRAGFEVVDTPSGWTLRAAAPNAETVYRRAEDVPSVLAQPPTAAFSVQWVDQGWPQDIERGIASFGSSHAGRAVQHVVVVASPERTTWTHDVDEVRVDPSLGWGAARNAALRRAAAPIVIVVDGSIEARGDVFEPIERALADPTIGAAGPFGIVSDDLREFRESDGPEVDAVEAYFLAFRRELLEGGLRFDEKFKFYRTADIELCFQIKALGHRAVVVPLPVVKHDHRMWSATPEEQRSRLSKRNFYRFLDRFRDRFDLCVTRRGEAPAD